MRWINRASVLTTWVRQQKKTYHTREGRKKNRVTKRNTQLNRKEKKLAGSSLIRQSTVLETSVRTYSGVLGLARAGQSSLASPGQY